MMMNNSTKKILWLHNNQSRNDGMFMWDILGAWRQGERFIVSEFAIGVMPKLLDLRDLISTVRTMAADSDLVHSQYGALVGLLGFFARKPLIVTLRGSDFYRMPTATWRGWLLNWVRVFFSGLSCKRAKIVIVMSERMRREIRRSILLRRKKVVVIPDPAGEEFWSCTSDEVNLKLKKTELHIFVGSFSYDNPIKRTEVIKKAIEICRTIGLNVSLLSLSGRPRLEVRDKMATCDVVALASTHEGWPNVIKEGMLLGLPFVSTDVGDLKDMVNHDRHDRIVDATPLDFALIFIDLYFAKILRSLAARSNLASFHPVCVAYKIEAAYRTVLQS